jgi:hypothetical protein
MTGPYLDARIDERLAALLLVRRLLPLALDFNAGSAVSTGREQSMPHSSRRRLARLAYGLPEDPHDGT